MAYSIARAVALECGLCQQPTPLRGATEIADHMVKVHGWQVWDGEAVAAEVVTLASQPLPASGALCPRCRERMAVSRMSIFNTEMICFDCAEEEKGAPGYPAARRAEDSAVRAGNWSYPGVGLQPDDLAYLAQARAARSDGRP